MVHFSSTPSACAVDITPLKINALITLWIPHPCGDTTANSACALPSDLQGAKKSSWISQKVQPLKIRTLSQRHQENVVVAVFG